MSDELVKEWIIKAEEDYRTVDALYSKSLSEFANTICFHSQQCAEKYLKALLITSGIEPPWIHSLESLLDLIVPKFPELEKYRALLAQLTPYATEYRYPGKIATEEEANICVTIIRELRNSMHHILRDG